MKCNYYLERLGLGFNSSVSFYDYFNSYAMLVEQAGIAPFRFVLVSGQDGCGVSLAHIILLTL